jgi:hypothetical protein
MRFVWPEMLDETSVQDKTIATPTMGCSHAHAANANWWESGIVAIPIIPAKGIKKPMLIEITRKLGM